MLRRWVPAGLLLSSVVAVSPTILAQTVPTKPATPTTAKPAAPTTAKPAAPTTAKPAATTAKPSSAAKPAPADDSRPVPLSPQAQQDLAKAAATPPADAKPAAPDPKAATTATPQSDTDKEATRLLEDAKKASKAGQWDKARELYAAAYKIKAEPSTLLLLAQAEAKSSRPRDAAEHLEIFLRASTVAGAEDKATAKKLFDEVTAKLGTWYIKVNVDGAELLLNGKPVGRSPLAAPLFVEPGSAEIEARKEGYAVEKELLAIAPNTESETELVMKPLPAEAVKPKKTEPETPPPPPPPPSPKWRTYGMIGGGALTVFGLGLGIGLTVSASGKGEEADAQLDELKRTTPNTYSLCGDGPTVFQANVAPCARLKDTLSSQDARANGAVAGFVIAGVGAVGTAGMFLLPKFSFGRKMMSMKITPVIGLDRLGGTVTGSF